VRRRRCTTSATSWVAAPAWRASTPSTTGTITRRRKPRWLRWSPPGASATGPTSSPVSSARPKRWFACSPATTWASWSSTCNREERDMGDVWAEVAGTRTELADLCESLSDAQWETQSLCDDWKVRDVVGHLAESTEKLGFGTLFVGMFKNGFNINK